MRYWFIILILLFTLSGCFEAETLGIDGPSLSTMVLRKIDNYDSSQIYRFESDDAILDVERFKSIEDDGMIKEKIDNIKSLYSRIECEDSYAPSYFGKEYVIAYSSADMRKNVCTEPEVSKKRMIRYIYCEDTKNLYVADLYVDKDTDNLVAKEFLESLRCT